MSESIESTVDSVETIIRQEDSTLDENSFPGTVSVIIVGDNLVNYSDDLAEQYDKSQLIRKFSEDSTHDVFYYQPRGFIVNEESIELLESNPEQKKFESYTIDRENIEAIRFINRGNYTGSMKEEV